MRRRAGASQLKPGSMRALEPGFTGQLLYRNDNFRTGQNLAESVLTPSTVNASNFGLQFTDALDGYAYTQPLYVPAVSIPSKGTHNVIYIATENDSVYAFDADAAGPPLWQTSFIDPANGITPVPSSDLGTSCTDLVPMIGITATPVIDPYTGTLYVVSKVKLGPGSYQQQLHALDITTGLEMPHSPVTITASVPGTGQASVDGIISFDPLLQHDRPALTLANGVVYLSFASHCDISPYHGWILGYDETMLAQEIVYNTTPNGSLGGIWEAGCGPGVDTNGDLITVTGNGTFDTGASPVDYGDSFLRLTPGVGTTGTMSVSTFFTPLDELMLEDDDLDMGSGGNLLLPDQPGPNTTSDDRHRQAGHYLSGRSRFDGWIQCLRRSDGAGTAQRSWWNVRHARILAGDGAGRWPAEHDLRDRWRRYAEDVRPRERNDPDATRIHGKRQLWISRRVANYLRQWHDRRYHVGN